MAMIEKPYVGEFRWQGEPNNSLIEMWSGEEWVLATLEPTNEELDALWDEKAGYFALYAEAERFGRAVLERWGRQ
jgi:hypothetical protein